MATAAQILANRENSKSSTGPRTPETKAISSANSRTHGFCSTDPVLPTESREEFNALLEQNKSEWKPETAHQEFLVSQMTGARWKLARLERMEVDLIASLESPQNAFTDDENAKKFARFERYRAALERTYHRCVRELRLAAKIQNEAKAVEKAEKEEREYWERVGEARRRRLARQEEENNRHDFVSPEAGNDNS